jgi:hypothetical protein
MKPSGSRSRRDDDLSIETSDDTVSCTDPTVSIELVATRVRAGGSNDGRVDESFCLPIASASCDPSFACAADVPEFDPDRAATRITGASDPAPIRLVRGGRCGTPERACTGVDDVSSTEAGSAARTSAGTSTSGSMGNNGVRSVRPTVFATGWPSIAARRRSVTVSDNDPCSSGLPPRLAASAALETTGR